MIEAIKKISRRYFWIFPIFIVSLVFILGGSYFSSPPLRSDDWNWLVWPTVFEPLKAINLADRRPFFSLFLIFLSSVFGLQIQWYYLVNWILLLLSGVVVYFIIKNAFVNRSWLALPVALIFLIYPVNYARTWLVTINNTYALLLTLLAILSMLTYTRSGKLYQIILANLLCIVSLWTYEAGLGIVFLAAALLIILTKHERRWALLSLIIVSSLFVVWRSFIQPQYLSVQDFYLQNANLSFFSLISRYIQGLFIFLFNWVGPLLLSFGDYKYWAFVGLNLFAISILIYLIIKKTKKLKSEAPQLYFEKINEVKSLLRISLVGALFWIAGYIPVIALWEPTFYGDSTRTNFVAILGAALIVVSLTAAVVTFLSKKTEIPSRMLNLVLVPFILLGMIYQIHSQNQRIKVWEFNKQFWQDMFQAVPNVKSETKLIVVVPGYQKLKPFEMLPFRGDWEVESALDVLYNNPDLFAEYYYLDSPVLEDNWIPTSGDYSNFLFIYFDHESGRFSIIQDPVASLNLLIDVQSYNPESKIIDFTPDVGEYRGLVD
jgi:hypothetical protein